MLDLELVLCSDRVTEEPYEDAESTDLWSTLRDCSTLCSAVSAGGPASPAAVDQISLDTTSLSTAAAGVGELLFGLSSVIGDFLDPLLAS